MRLGRSGCFKKPHRRPLGILGKFRFIEPVEDLGGRVAVGMSTCRPIRSLPRGIHRFLHHRTPSRAGPNFHRRSVLAAFPVTCELSHVSRLRLHQSIALAICAWLIFVSRAIICNSRGCQSVPATRFLLAHTWVLRLFVRGTTRRTDIEIPFITSRVLAPYLHFLYACLGVDQTDQFSCDLCTISSAG